MSELGTGLQVNLPGSQCHVHTDRWGQRSSRPRCLQGEQGWVWVAVGRGRSRAGSLIDRMRSGGRGVSVGLDLQSAIAKPRGCEVKCGCGASRGAGCETIVSPLTSRAHPLCSCCWMQPVSPQAVCFFVFDFVCSFASHLVCCLFLLHRIVEHCCLSCCCW